MRWYDLALEAQWGGNPCLSAQLASLMWAAAAASGDQGLCTNLRMNCYDPSGLAYALDWAGVSVTQAAVELLDQSPY